MRSVSVQLSAVLCLLWAGVAAAWPVDGYLDVSLGTPLHERLGVLSWAETDDPRVATVTLLPSGEVLLEGKTPGRTLLMGYAEGRFGVWRVRVMAKGRPVAAEHGDALLVEAHARCRSLKETPKEETLLTVTVTDERCREALRTLFTTDDYTGKGVDVTFELETLQSQLGALEQAFRAAGLSALTVRYLGAGLELHGTASEPDHRRALFEIFKTAVGHVGLDDQVELPSLAPALPPPL